MAKRPHLSFWQIWNMSFGFLGIQFGFALQNANVSRIFETLGAKIENIPILWVAAPLTGLIIQPIIGHLSDKTWNKLGRRRPYFLSGAILASLALFFMPNSPALWVAAGTLWIMDASINVSMEPFRAFVGDMLPGDQRTKGFAMQSFFIGAGAVIASMLPFILTNWLGFENTAPEGQIPDSVKYSFYIGGFVFLSSVIWTVIKTKEYSPSELADFEKTEHPERFQNSETRIDEKIIEPKTFFRRAAIWLPIGVIACLIIWNFDLEAELYILSGGVSAFGLMELLTGFLVKINKTENGFAEVTKDLNRLPKTMAQLAVVQFFTWFALFAMWIYTTNSITSTKYNMSLDKDSYIELNTVISTYSDDLKLLPSFDGAVKDLDEAGKAFNNGKLPVGTMQLVKFFKEKEVVSKAKLSAKAIARLHTIEDEYNKGANWVGVLFGAYSLIAALVAFLLPLFAKLTSRKITHAISLVCGGLGLISLYIIPDPKLLIISMIGVGIAWASILAMPYAMLTGALPQHKMGTYMGIFNFFIVIPQLLAASLLGFFVKTLFHGHSILALVLGGISMIVAAIMVLFVEDKKDS